MVLPFFLLVCDPDFGNDPYNLFYITELAGSGKLKQAPLKTMNSESLAASLSEAMLP
jgi:hypothetical protein